MNIVLVTTTSYRDTAELRYGLFLSTLQKATDNGYKIVVVDDSPDPTIMEKASQLGARCFRGITQGMGVSRRFAFFLARETALEMWPAESIIFIWLEPEKDDFIRSIPLIITPIANGQADIVISRRSPKSLRTYPKFQQRSEKRMNAAYKKVTGLKGFDPAFGPVAFNIWASSYFIGADGRIWGVPDTYIQHYAPLIACQDGLRVVSKEIDFIYPREQRKEEESTLSKLMGQKRLLQMEMLSNAYRTIAEKLSEQK